MVQQNLTFEQLPFEVRALSEKVQRLTELLEAKPQQPKEEDDLMTRKEARDAMRVSDPTFWRYAKLGIIKTYKIQGRVYVKRSELMEVISNNVTKK